MPANQVAHWKEKYSRLLDDYERLEQASQTRTGLLERGLVRSSLAAEGQDPRLDRHLQSLRDSIRKEGNLTQLQQIIDDLERHLLATESQRGNRLQILVSALDSLSGQLLATSPEHGSQQALKKLQKALKESQQLQYNLHDWLLELSQLQAKILENDQPERAAGLFDRLLGKQPAKPALADEQDSRSDNPQPPAPDTTTTAPAETPLALQQAVSSDPMPAEPVRQALLKLMHELPVGEQDQQQLRLLEQKLQPQAGWDTLTEALNALAELIIRTNTLRQQEFGKYLEQINNKLGQITGTVSRTTDSYQASIASAASLDRDLHTQVSEMHRDMQQADNLEELKQRVDQRLNLFIDTLDQHQQQRQQSEQALLLQLQELNDRVQQVEAEAAELTSQLVEQHQKARQDALTGLPNRGAWDERLEIEHSRLSRQDQPLLLVVIDVDRFKRINDSYGHPAGDRVLKILAERLKSSIRKTDFLARYGGEEFAMLLPDTPLEYGERLVNKLRERVAECPFHFKGEPVKVTFSAGIGQIAARESTEEAFARVDQALYQAKEEGRDRVKVAAPARC